MVGMALAQVFLVIGSKFLKNTLGDARDKLRAFERKRFYRPSLFFFQNGTVGAYIAGFSRVTCVMCVMAD